MVGSVPALKLGPEQAYDQSRGRAFWQRRARRLGVLLVWAWQD
jgi:hypothetical protein